MLSREKTRATVPLLDLVERLGNAFHQLAENDSCASSCAAISSIMGDACADVRWLPRRASEDKDTMAVSQFYLRVVTKLRAMTHLFHGVCCAVR